MPAVELIGINKTFPGGVAANRDITLRIEKGEIHGLLGENGAGKTTLMNILYGLISKDAGTIVIDGQSVDLKSPQDAIAHGIGMVHQHFKLIPTLTVAENIILGMESTDRKDPLAHILPIKLSSAIKRIEEIAKSNGLVIDPRAKIRDLSVGLQQRVEILKALYRDARILILDEPTSVLTPQEVDELFESLERFRRAGRTIILITHKLRETMAICDRISVLRDGLLINTVARDETSAEQLAEMMVGRPVEFVVHKEPANPGPVVFSVKDLHANNSRGLPAVRGVNLSIRAGEILGVAGVEGNGQTELVEAIVGLRRPSKGEIRCRDIDITGRGPRTARMAGLSHIPEDRHKRGLVLQFTISENLVLGRHRQPQFTTGPLGALLDLEKIDNMSKQLVDSFSIKVPSTDKKAVTLSGGNQQKVIAAREIDSHPTVIIAAQPTRGLDVGATEYIHRELIKMRDNGVAILLVSAELDEVLALSDRIVVMYNGRIVGMRTPQNTTPQELGLFMAGHKEEPVTDEEMI